MGEVVKELSKELKEKVKDGVRRGVIKKVQVEIVEIVEKEKMVRARLKGQRRIREFIAYKTADTKDLIIQADDTIVMPIGHYSDEWTLCIYNVVKGKALFLHLRYGAKLALISRDFIGIMEMVRFRDGDVMGYVEGSPVVYRES